MPPASAGPGASANRFLLQAPLDWKTPWDEIPRMEQNPNPLADPKFYYITAGSTALGMGCMLAFLVSLRDIRSDLTFEFSVKTVLFFFLGAAIGWGFWAFVRSKTANAK